MIYYAFTDNASYPKGPIDGRVRYWKTPHCFVYSFNPHTYTLHTHVIQAEVIGNVLEETPEYIITNSVYVHSVEPVSDWVNKQSEAIQIMCVRKSILVYELIREPSEVLRKEKDAIDQSYHELGERNRELRDSKCVIL